MRIDYPRRHRSGVRRYMPSWRQVLVVIGAGLLATLAVAGWAYAATVIPAPSELAKAQTTIVYYADGKTELGRFGALNRIAVPLARVPEPVREAVLAAEDRSFYRNQGISPTGIVRAAWNNLRGGPTQGASTITQQYAKNAFLTQDRTWARKLRELFIAVKLDRETDKNKILEDYLNTIYFGRGAYGIQTAAQAYFGRDVQQLSVSEGAVLAAVIRSPGSYSPTANAELLKQRWAYVLDGMVSEGWLSPADRARQVFPTHFADTGRVNRLAGPGGYLLDTTRDELARHGISEAQLDVGGYRVTTTFEKKAQDAAVSAVRRKFPKHRAKNAHAGLAAVRPGTGEVVAMYGGPDYVTRSGINDAVTSRIQPGSAVKPFTLAAALEQGIGLRSRFAGNSPLWLPGGSSVNNEFDQSYGSSVDLLTATEKSINTAFVDLTTHIGPSRVENAMVRAGIPKDSPGLKPFPVITLGTASVAPVDLANAYATLAARGQRATWHVVKEVRRSDGELAYRATTQTRRAFAADVAADVTYALRQVVESPAGTGTAAQAVGRPVAAKTGTAEDLSAWFVGFTPQLAAAVDFYNGDGTKSLNGVAGMATFFGGGYPADIWTAFMKAALKGSAVQDFPPRAYLGHSIGVVPLSRHPTSLGTPNRSSGPTQSVTPTSSPTSSAVVTPTPRARATSPTSTTRPTRGRRTRRSQGTPSPTPGGTRGARGATATPTAPPTP